MNELSDITTDMIYTPKVQSFFDPNTNTISYVVADETTKRCAIIDSVMDYEPHSATLSFESADTIIAYIRKEGYTVEWILETHAHADHLSAAPYLQQILGGKIAIGAHITIVQEVFGKVFNEGTEFRRDGSQFDALWKEGDIFHIGTLPVRVLETPGHTPADISYVIGDAVFVGDTLFMPDFGTARCDFPGGSARTMYASIQKLWQLPESMRMFLCHDYLPEGRTEYIWETTVGEQKKQNIHIKEGTDPHRFVQTREERDRTLGMPRLIIPSIQTNIQAGNLPQVEDNGVSYLKTPVNGAFSKKM
jgi:glyoxylase-like metal-dependent hydrolase (beta-lactamase superfamily II)